MPFCSEECRREQIEIDEAKERSSKIFIKASSSRKDQQRKNADAGGAKSEKIHVRAGTVVTASEAVVVISTGNPTAGIRDTGSIFPSLVYTALAST
ncbi:hypothetical protein B296_00055432 [Ensete ventricosum]|uniref:FLZ-type domain-containing protein n=1 Tax=Ensete ventricosum TaxID=4639 RepID=A0A426X610_ENSVE|nr:hypothetical protein B296_00055432 [Ensete ventricosum]